MSSACALLHPYALTVRHGLPFAAQWCGLCRHLVFPEPTPSRAPVTPVPPAGHPARRWAPAPISGSRPG